MKRTARALLAAVLAAALALPAAAADPTDQRMTQVTQAVKEQLNIGDSYTTFYGDLTENEFRTCWTLNWEKEGDSIRVVADQEGTIYQYDRSREDAQAADSGSAFPALSRQEALPYAQTFAGQVLHAPESVRLTAGEETGRVGVQTYSFQSQVLLYGLPSPIGVWMRVDARDGTVVSYHRDDLYQTYLNEPADPAGYAGMTDTAAPLLKGTLELRLEYVPDEAHSGRAVLRYVPVYGDDWYVDAATGELVNLSQLYRDLAEDQEATGAPGATGGAAGDSSNSLTDAEQEGIAQMAGVWAKEDLDSRARTCAPLKLEGWTLSSCSYQLDRESGQVTASLRYTRAQAGSTSRTVTLDGKTGALLGASGYAWPEEGFTPTVSQQAAQKTAEAFVASLWGEQWQSCALYESTPAGEDSRIHSFTFAQKVNGYFYPTNSITVGVDSADGAVLRLSRSFDSTPAFDDPAGVISQQAALDAWFATYTVTEGYTAVPRQLDRYGDRYQDLIARGYTYLMSLELGCTLEREDSLLGIDAKTGQPVELPDADPGRPVYSDLAGSWGQTQAQALAAYGIGWLGGKLEPDKELTQLDLMALLVSTQSGPADLSREGEADRVYDRAVSMGLITRSQRQDDKPVTRAQVTKVLLDWGGYGNAAVIPGIFRCTFTDQGDIPAEYYGYAAIAQGLGVVQGDALGRFLPNRTATRLEAVAMLYQFLAR